MLNDNVINPIILCGGSGTRLWPVSRESFPKQFSKLVGEKTLFQTSALLCVGDAFAAPIVVTGDMFRFIVVEQLALIEVAPARIMIEPSARNTAAAIAAAAVQLAATDPNALMLVLPSDHIIPDVAAFQTAVGNAVPAALAGNLVTFGISPDRAETGYGYLELAPDADLAAAEPQRLARFVEKPDQATAVEMLATGRYFWNAGIFLFTAKAMIDAFTEHAPETLDAVTKAVARASNDLGFTRISADEWSKIENVSIDYAIMEKAQNLFVMPYRASWSDLGSWESIYQQAAQDSAGNVVSAHATAIECRDSLLRSEAGSLELVGIGLTDMIAIAMPDAVLVARKSDSQLVKAAVERLKAQARKQAASFESDHRPWGHFESIARGDRFQVKRIVVNPGAALSLQSHFHRSEHWIVVQGTARVTVDDQVKLLAENESVYIPLASVHRLENPGKVPMVLIEVQTGSYLGEDDIIRYEDVYARD
jgi:mannose-1-phosphate guanylyltransferase / mannose-6-phosphate isomerase